VSVGVGVRGVPRGVKLRIGAAFATAEVTMNLIGAGLGLMVGNLLGDVAGYLGFAALIVVGLYMIWESLRESEEPSLDMSRGWGLFIAAITVSLDSLGIGFSILYVGVPLTVSLPVIGVVSVCATATGLALGRRLGNHVEERAEIVSGYILALTGIVFIVLKALHIG
jgi:putative Mn2+ efflux pump MntP